MVGSDNTIIKQAARKCNEYCHHKQHHKEQYILSRGRGHLFEHERDMHTAGRSVEGETVLFHAPADSDAPNGGNRLETADPTRRQPCEDQCDNREQSHRQNQRRRTVCHVKAEACLQRQDIDQRGKQPIGKRHAEHREQQRRRRVGQYLRRDDAARCKAQRFEHTHLRHFFGNGGFDAEPAKEDAHEQDDDRKRREYYGQQICYHHAGLLPGLPRQGEQHGGLLLLGGLAEIGQHGLTVCPFPGAHRVIDHLAAFQCLR